MKRNGKGVMKFIALCSLTIAIIYGTALVQQPRFAALRSTAADAEERVGRVTRERLALSEASERDRVLLERIERLEHRLKDVESRLSAADSAESIAGSLLTRLNEVESRLNAADVGKTPTTSAHPLQPTNAASQQNPTQSAATTALAQQPIQTTQATPPALPPYAAWDKGGVKIIPYGILIANLNYNSSALAPGSFAGFAFPDAPDSTAQFNISPGNTYLGVDIKGPKIGEWEINGKVDFDLRGPTPLRVNNVFAPLFINLYGEARTERYRILAGQAPDIISPLFSNSLNIYPAGFQPGRLGFFRPQVRFETYQPISKDFTFTFQGAVAEAIQTFQVGEEAIGTQAGLPDGQIRLALGYGEPDLNDRFQRRPFELGVSGHIGKRRGTRLGVRITEREFTTWSGDIDLSFKIGGKLRFDGEFFSGSVLGDYAGGAFQTFNPVRLVAIRAAGAWAQLTYDISDKWQVNGGYGRDDPYNRDLAFGQRSLNVMGFGNFYYKITPRLWVATEFSRWKTTWVSLPTGKPFRVEPAVLFFF